MLIRWSGTFFLLLFFPRTGVILVKKWQESYKRKAHGLCVPCPIVSIILKVNSVLTNGLFRMSCFSRAAMAFWTLRRFRNLRKLSLKPGKSCLSYAAQEPPTYPPRPEHTRGGDQRHHASLHGMSLHSFNQIFYLSWLTQKEPDWFWAFCIFKFWKNVQVQQRKSFSKHVSIWLRYGNSKIDWRLHKMWHVRRLILYYCKFGVSCVIFTIYPPLATLNPILSNCKNCRQLQRGWSAIRRGEPTRADWPSRWHHSFQQAHLQNDADWSYCPFLASWLIFLISSSRHPASSFYR